MIRIKIKARAYMTCGVRPSAIGVSCLSMPRDKDKPLSGTKCILAYY